MIDNYYDEIARGYNQLHGEEQTAKVKAVLNEVEIPKDASLLDVGCGTGIVTELFECKKVGIDPAVKLLKQASFPTIICVAEDLPFRDESFDVVVSFTAAHNFNDFKQGLLEMKRVARREGIIIISLLKKAKNYNIIAHFLKKEFDMKKTLDNSHDSIFILHQF